MWAFTQRLDYLATAKRAASHLLNEERNSEGKRARKFQTLAYADQRKINTETDYFVGPLGVGSALLRLHLAVHGEYSSIHFPDNRVANVR